LHKFAPKVLHHGTFCAKLPRLIARDSGLESLIESKKKVLSPRRHPRAIRNDLIKCDNGSE
jgi:hypothetical protein